MGTYNLRIITTAFKNGEPFGDHDNTFPGLDSSALTEMLADGTKIEAAVKQATSKKGPVNLTLACIVTSPSGDPIPPGVNGVQTFNGLTRHGYSDVEDNILDIGKKLVKIGRAHATAKEGPRK